MPPMFADVYRGKKVLVTGHTGFKGSWLCTWLLRLGADVVGYSDEVPTEPSLFEAIGLQSRIRHVLGDVRDLDHVRAVLSHEQPDFVFHLAAQAIVSTSYLDPARTMSTNIIGTMNMLEALRHHQHPCIAVMITSDKCYDNVEWVWGYRETDALGGKDIYSGSKGAAELVIKSYVNSFFASPDCAVVVGIGRAGNVIGGGDWALDRIVADCMRAWSEGRAVEIRSPRATRPWQHVLEPLSGYLTLGASLRLGHSARGEAYNFGPRAEQNHTVAELLKALAGIWGFAELSSAYRVTGNIPFHEASLLKLNCDKALMYLQWEATLQYGETIQMLGEWYKQYYAGSAEMFTFTGAQIAQYEHTAHERGLRWTL
jgi:CDP-glucose 4,6-dehydratase